MSGGWDTSGKVSNGQILKDAPCIDEEEFGGLFSEDQCSSKHGPQTSSIGIMWQLIRNANSQAPLRPTESAISEEEPSNLYFNKSSRGF